MNYIKLALWAIALGVTIGMTQDAFKGGVLFWIVVMVLLLVFVFYKFGRALLRVF